MWQWKYPRQNSEAVLSKPCQPPQVPRMPQSTSALRPRMPGGACPNRFPAHAVRPRQYGDQSAITPLYPLHGQSDMYKNDGYYPDYGTKDVSYQPSSGNNSHSTNEYTTSERRSTREQVPSYYYKDYVPVGNSLPQTPTPTTLQSENNVFTTTAPLSASASTTRMNGYVRNKSTSGSKSDSPESRETNKTATILKAEDEMSRVQRFIPVLNLYGVHSNAAALGLTSIISLALGILAMQMLFTIGAKTSKDFEGKIVDELMYEILYQAAVALSSVVLMLNLTCTLICTMQCFFVARLLKLKRGYIRAFRYLKDCSAVRLISTAGFFMSIPTFLAALILYCIMELRMTAAIIASVVIGLGVVLCLAAYVETIVHLARHRNDEDDPDDDGKEDQRAAANAIYGICQPELSTLV